MEDGEVIFMRAKDIYCVGDRIMEGSRRNPIDQSWAEEHEDACKRSRFARDLLSKQEATWDMNTRLEDIRIMAKLESVLSKTMFPIVTCLPDRYSRNLVHSVVKELEFPIIIHFNQLSDIIEDIQQNERRLVLTSYDYKLGNLSGRDVSSIVEDVNIVSYFRTYHCMVDGYNNIQRNNLSASGYDTFKLLIGSADRELICNGLRSLILGYYVMFLIETIFGMEELKRVINKETSLNTSLEELEKLINRKNFKVLSVGNLEHNKATLDICKQLSIPQVTYVGDAKQAIEIFLDGQTFDVVLSDYRLSDKPANKLFDNILRLSKSHNDAPEFLITGGYKTGEVLHLKRYGIRIFDEIDPQNIEVFLKGTYVNKIRKFLAKGL